jgi:hypothetical protein
MLLMLLADAAAYAAADAYAADADQQNLNLQFLKVVGELK